MTDCPRGRHGGYAAQAVRRGEEFAGCTHCGRMVTMEPMDWGEFTRALMVGILLACAVIALTYAVAGYL